MQFPTFNERAAEEIVGKKQDKENEIPNELCVGAYYMHLMSYLMSDEQYCYVLEDNRIFQ